MADNTIINLNTTVGDTIATLEDGSGIKHEQVVLEFLDPGGEPVQVSAADPLPVLASIDTTGLATEDKQDDQITFLTSIAAEDFATQTTSAAILAKIIAAPATEAKQDTGNASLASIAAEDFATQTTLAAVLAKIIAAPATEAKQDSEIALLTTIDGDTGNISTKIDTIAGAVSGTEMQVDVLTMPTVTVQATNLDVRDLTFAADKVDASGTVLGAGSNLIGIVQTKDIPDASNTYALSNATSSAYEASRVIKASAGYLFMVTGYNSLATPQFIQLHNTTSVPADTAVPVVIFRVTGESNFSFDLGKFGRYFSTGITIVNSTTGPTKTIGASNCWFDCQFI
jgi:hypothetical protein